MKYFKNTELAKLYNVSEKSVRNWVQAAAEGKLDLRLFDDKGRKFIANSELNTIKVQELAAKGKKYTNFRAKKIVSPSSKFYDLYTPGQIFDIVSNLNIYKEIPLQYCYFNGGAEFWDTYTQHLLEEQTHNPLTNTIELLDNNMAYIDGLVGDDAMVNIVDIGVGNGLPIKKVLAHFTEAGKLNRYIGLDISSELLQIAKTNIEQWFRDTIHFEGSVKDFNSERFGELLIADSFNTDKTPVVNLIFFLGGTINNLREPNRVLATIHDSMGKDDLFLFSKKLDTEKSRRHFDVTAPGNLATTLVLDLLNIDRSFYDLEQTFNSNTMARELRAQMKISLSIDFELGGKAKRIELNKDDSILLWRARHQTAIQTIEEFDENGFELVQATKSSDQEYLLMISKLKHA